MSETEKLLQVGRLTEEAVEAFRERDRLRTEVAEAGKRLNSLAPNVTGIMY